MVGKNRIRRRDVLKTTGGLLGGFAIAGAVATPATAQPTYFRYDRLRVQLVDVESVPPRFLSVESPLYLTQALLSECDTGHPCSIQILDYRRTDDGDDDDDQDDDGDDTGADDGQDDEDDGDDGDGACPGFASVVLLCHAGSTSDAVVMTGLIRDVLTQYADQGVDFAISLTPSTATNVDTPRQVSNPCPGDDDGDDGGDDGGQDDGGQDDDGDDDGNDNGNDGDDGGQGDGDDTGDDDGGGDDDN